MHFFHIYKHEVLKDYRDKNQNVADNAHDLIGMVCCVNRHHLACNQSFTYLQALKHTQMGRAQTHTHTHMHTHTEQTVKQ